MLCNYTVTNEVNQTQHFILSKIMLLTLSHYMFQPITRSSSGETNIKYAKDDYIKM
jgi:hypothetical protein